MSLPSSSERPVPPVHHIFFKDRFYAAYANRFSIFWKQVASFHENFVLILGQWKQPELLIIFPLLNQ